MKEVASQFDSNMPHGWRNAHHKIQLDLFLGLARELPVHLTTKVDYYISGLNAGSCVGTHAATPSSSTSYPFPDRFLHHNRPIIFPSFTNPTGASYATLSDISRPTSSSFTSSTNEFLYPKTSLATSIDLLSTTSGPTTPTASTAGSDSGSGVTLCELCPDVKFTGKPESQKRSLNRHNKKHNKEDIPTCSTCGTTFEPGRTDNLNRHLKHFNHQ